MKVSLGHAQWFVVYLAKSETQTQAITYLLAFYGDRHLSTLVQFKAESWKYKTTAKNQAWNGKLQAKGIKMIA